MLLPWDTDFLYRTFLVFLRLGALLFFIPIFSASGIPTMVKTAFALLFANLVSMVLPMHPALPTHWIMLVVAGLNEIMLGLFMGLIVHTAFDTIALAGQIISIEGGFMRDNSFDPISRQPSSPIEKLLFYFAIMIFLTTGMHLEVFSAFIKSFEVAPPGVWMPGEGNIVGLIAATAQIFTTAVQMAAPFIALNFIINMTFAVLGKAAPQMSVFVISFAVLIVGGLLMLTFTMDVLTQYIGTLMRELAGNMLTLVQTH